MIFTSMKTPSPAAAIRPFPPTLCPAWPVVLGNVADQEFEFQLRRLDPLLIASGVAQSFVEQWRARCDRQCPAANTQSRARHQRPRDRARRGNVLRGWIGEAYRGRSRRRAEGPRFRWCCGLEALAAVRGPGKSTWQDYARWRPAATMRPLIAPLILAAHQPARAAALALAPGRALETVWRDTTGWKTHIPFPVDWVLLGAAGRTLMTATRRMRAPGLQHRMASPERLRKAMNLNSAVQRAARERKERKERRFNSTAGGFPLHPAGEAPQPTTTDHSCCLYAFFVFSCGSPIAVFRMNRLSLPRPFARRAKDSQKQRTKTLRLLQQQVTGVPGPARRHRALWDQAWHQTDWPRPQAEAVLRRLDGVRALLPQAQTQAPERIIGARRVDHADTVLSLDETDPRGIGRGKAGAPVALGNTLRRAEQRDGVIVDWPWHQASAPADGRHGSASLERMEKACGAGVIRAMGADRGCSSAANETLLKGKGIYAGIGPKQPARLKARRREERLVERQRRRSQTEGRVAIFKNGFWGRPLRAKG